MTTRQTSRLSPRLIRRLRGAWLVLALFIFVTWALRFASATSGDGLLLLRYASATSDDSILMRFVNATGDGLTLLRYAVEVVTFAAFAIIAITLYRRRGDDWLALFTGMLLLLTVNGYTGSRPDNVTLKVATFWLISLMETFQVTFFYIFPDGKFLPKWAKYGVVPFLIFRLVIWENIYRNNLLQGSLEVSFVVLLLLIGIGTQIYRYRRHASPIERQQVKWLLVGFTMTILFVAPSVYIISVFEGQSRAVVAVVVILRTLALLIVPVSLGISITRYRLWELDLTINRTVVGAAVTAVLAAVFGAAVFVSQAAVQALFGPQSALIPVAVGLGVAGLTFNPARRRVRRFIDRQLYDFRFDLNDLRTAQTPPQVKKPGALTGQTIGAYQILDLLGRGGMGEVYMGFGGERVVAVKIMPPEIASEGKNALRFAREIEALRALDHPNVVRLIDSGAQADLRYMAMDFIDGKDITHLLRETGALRPSAAYDILKQVGAALSYIHAENQIHRDVTSGNIMLRANGDSYDAILMDFGLVKMLAATSGITMSGDVMGTIDYMAPEQIVQTQTVDFRSDIYALGAVYYEMLTGKRPFTGGPAQVLFAHLYQPPPDIRLVLPDCPRHVARAIMRAMAKTPDERFQTVDEFIMAVEGVEVAQMAA